jgi:hypothetical protein
VPAPHVVDAPPTVFRVARRDGVLSCSRIDPADALLPDAGNRFDVPGGGVLYAATRLDACYAETLARFRPSPRIREVVKGEKDGFMVTGGIPQDWRLQRVRAVLGIEEALPFLDVEDPRTHGFLSEELSPMLVALGYGGQELDFSDLCNHDRRISRAIAEYAYTAHDDDGSPTYSGIRYMSRIDPRWECWAIFEGTKVLEIERTKIELHDPDFEAIVDMWGLRAF